MIAQLEQVYEQKLCTIVEKYLKNKLRLFVLIHRKMFFQVATDCFVPDIKSGQAVPPADD
jgi:hypothetical protein